MRHQFLAAEGAWIRWNRGRVTARLEDTKEEENVIDVEEFVLHDIRLEIDLTNIEAKQKARKKQKLLALFDRVDT